MLFLIQLVNKTMLSSYTSSTIMRSIFEIHGKNNESTRVSLMASTGLKITSECFTQEGEMGRENEGNRAHLAQPPVLIVRMK